MKQSGRLKVGWTLHPQDSPCYLLGKLAK